MCASPSLRIMLWPISFAIRPAGDRKSTRLNSSHVRISYAVFCLKKKKKIAVTTITAAWACRTLTQTQLDTALISPCNIEADTTKRVNNLSPHACSVQDEVLHVD